MSNELLISLILLVPLLVAGAVLALNSIPDVREAATLVGAGALFILDGTGVLPDGERGVPLDADCLDCLAYLGLEAGSLGAVGPAS